MKKLFLTVLLILTLFVNMPANSDCEVKFSRENLITEVLQSDIKYKDVFIAQTILETGGYSSEIFKVGNNLCGMRLPKKRQTTAIGSYKGYAKYSCWTQSLRDYAIWQSKYVSKYNTKEKYLVFLNRVYSTDGTYSTKLKKVLKTLTL